MTGKVKHSENYNLVARKSIFNLIIRGPNEHVHRDHNKTVCGSVLTVLTISCNKNSTLMIKVIGFMILTKYACPVQNYHCAFLRILLRSQNSQFMSNLKYL